MKKLKLKSKITSLFLCILILIQSCQIYRSGNLSKAVEERTKTKVFMTTGESLKFKKVIYNEKGKYVGIKKKNGELREYEINDKLVKEVKVKNRTMSIVNTIVLSSLVVGFAYVVIKGFGTGKIDWSQVGNQ